jgi:hypothetical protein
VATTAPDEGILTAPPSHPRPEPGPVGRGDVSEVLLDRASHIVEERFTVLQSHQTGRPDVRAAPFSVTVDEFGNFIIQDITGAVYGTGPTYAEAHADFVAALDEHLAYLRSHQAELAPRLLDQLGELQRLFPGR